MPKQACSRFRFFGNEEPARSDSGPAGPACKWPRAPPFTWPFAVPLECPLSLHLRLKSPARVRQGGSSRPARTGHRDIFFEDAGKNQALSAHQRLQILRIEPPRPMRIPRRMRCACTSAFPLPPLIFLPQRSQDQRYRQSVRGPSPSGHLADGHLRRCAKSRTPSAEQCVCGRPGRRIGKRPIRFPATRTTNASVVVIRQRLHSAPAAVSCRPKRFQFVAEGDVCRRHRNRPSVGNRRHAQKIRGSGRHGSRSPLSLPVQASGPSSQAIFRQKTARGRSLDVGVRSIGGLPR